MLMKTPKHHFFFLAHLLFILHDVTCKFKHYVVLLDNGSHSKAFPLDPHERVPNRSTAGAVGCSAGLLKTLGKTAVPADPGLFRERSASGFLGSWTF